MIDGAGLSTTEPLTWRGAEGLTVREVGRLRCEQNQGDNLGPGWGPFEGPDSADLDEAALGGLAEAAIPVPEGVTRAPVHYTDQRRFDVPVTLICPEFTPEDAKGWIDAGDVPELVQAQVHYVDLKTGHWPMVSAPADLAGILADLADQHGSAR